MSKSEKQPSILKILEALPEGKTGIEGKSIVELCAMLVKWVENRSLYSDIGSGSAQSRVDFLKKIGFDNFKFNYQYRLGNKQRVYDAKISSAEDFVTTMDDLQKLPAKSGQLDALKEAISRQIADYVLSQIPTATDEKNPISLDDEFAVSLTRDVLGVADDVNMVQTVQEYANNGANTAAVIDSLETARKLIDDKAPFIPDDVSKSLKSITPVKPPKEKTRFKDVVANLFTRKERSVNLDNVARYVAMSMLLSVDPALSGYDKLNLVMKEYRLRSVDGIKRGAPETEGVDYESLVSGAMQSIRDNRLAISNNTPYQKAINSFIDAGGVDANIPEDVKAELSKEGILDK